MTSASVVANWLTLFFINVFGLTLSLSAKRGQFYKGSNTIQLSKCKQPIAGHADNE